MSKLEERNLEEIFANYDLVIVDANVIDYKTASRSRDKRELDVE